MINFGISGGAAKKVGIPKTPSIPLPRIKKDRPLIIQWMTLHRQYLMKFENDRGSAGFADISSIHKFPLYLLFLPCWKLVVEAAVMHYYEVTSKRNHTAGVSFWLEQLIPALQIDAGQKFGRFPTIIF